jgi:hypothetical protein
MHVEDAAFAQRHGEIRAMWGHGEASQTSREERMEGERLAVLAVVCEVCERTPGLDSDWYAISPVG